MRLVSAGACLVLVLATCGGGSLSLSEYNTRGQALVTVMEARIDILDAEWDSQTPTVERARTYWDDRLKARASFLDGIQALDPPERIAELHSTGLDLFRRLIAAEEALAARVALFETPTEPEQWWNTAEGMAVQTVDEEITAFCLVFQASYDETIERMSFSEMAWIPSEMKETVQIDLGC